MQIENPMVIHYLQFYIMQWKKRDNDWIPTWRDLKILKQAYECSINVGHFLAHTKLLQSCKVKTMTQHKRLQLKSNNAWQAFTRDEIETIKILPQIWIQTKQGTTGKMYTTKLVSFFHWKNSFIQVVKYSPHNLWKSFPSKHIHNQTICIHVSRLV